MKNVSKHILFCLLLLTAAGNICAEKKTFTKDYTYQASEKDSKVDSRKNASDEMQKILLREIGTYIISEQQTSVQGNEQDYLEKIVEITAGTVKMEVLDEQWDGKTYYIKATMTVDPDDVNKRIAEVLNDKQKTKDLEEALKRARKAESEIEKLKREKEAERKQLAAESKKALEEEVNKALQAHQTQASRPNTTTSRSVAKEQNLEGYRREMQKNYAEAASWYRKSAVQGNYAPAQYNLGLLYEFGYGVKKNKKEAKRWYQAAAAQGIREAGERLKKL